MTFMLVNSQCYCECLAEHDGCHYTGEDGFARLKRQSQMGILDPSPPDLTYEGGFSQPGGGDPVGEESEDPSVSGSISLSKTPIMKMKSKSEPKRIAVSLKVAAFGIYLFFNYSIHI